MAYVLRVGAAVGRYLLFNPATLKTTPCKDNGDILRRGLTN